MGNLTTATIFVVIVNVLMWMVQLSVIDVNPDGSVCYNVNGTIIGENMQGGEVKTDIASKLPSSESGVTAGSSTGFVTDLFNSILGWMKGLPGVNYAVNIVKAPTNILKCMSVPHDFAVAIGVMWYSITIFLVISWIFWRD